MCVRRWLLEKKTEEGKSQIELEKARAQEAEEKEQAAFERKLIAKDAGEALPDVEETDFKLDMRIRNQFDFAERASQTFNLTLRERVMSTEPPPSSTVTGIVNQVPESREMRRRLMRLCVCRLRYTTLTYAR